ncbi:MAG: hypothetical protein V5A72_03575 [Candidatus Nanohaloarchaea archaeon]
MDIFMKEKPVLALIAIDRYGGDIYATKVAQRINTTYAHSVKIISRLEEKGLVESQLEGRKKILDITEDGRLHAELLEEILSLRNEELIYETPVNQNSLVPAWKEAL